MPAELTKSTNKMTEDLIIACPTCKKSIRFKDSPYRPFCSKRCQLIDLGEWVSENHTIAGESAPQSDPSENNFSENNFSENNPKD